MFIPTTACEVENIIRCLPNKGNLMFDITPKLLNYIIQFISPILSEFYNKCFLSGIYPDILKISRVVPVFKSGDAYDVSNYRPISNLSTINKVFEIITLGRISSFLDVNNIKHLLFI